MATVTGSLVYDNTRMNIDTSPGIANVPMVLQNIDTGQTLAVLTDSNGQYTFENVPEGNYQVVEYYGYTPTTSSPGDFLTATNQTIITTGGITPPINYVSNPAPGATDLDGVTPTTMKFSVPTTTDTTTVSTIRNGPVKYTPFSKTLDSEVKVDPKNFCSLKSR